MASYGPLEPKSASSGDSPCLYSTVAVDAGSLGEGACPSLLESSSSASNLRFWPTTVLQSSEMGCQVDLMTFMIGLVDWEILTSAAFSLLDLLALNFVVPFADLASS